MKPNVVKFSSVSFIALISISDTVHKLLVIIIKRPGPNIFRKTFLRCIVGRDLSLREVITQKAFKRPTA